MSASQDKKKRLDEKAEAGMTKRELADVEEARKKKKTRATTIIVVVVCVLVAAAALFYNSGAIYRLPAVSVNGVNHSARELGFYYRTSYYNFLETYSDFASYMIDSETPLDEQQFSDEQTWADYFKESAATEMCNTDAFVAAAGAAGFTMPEDYEITLSNQLAYFDLYATYGGYASTDQYLSMNFGKGCDKKLAEKLTRDGLLSTAYRESVYDGFSYTDAELEAEYQANADNYDELSYAYYYVDGSADTEAGEVAEDTMAAAKTAADALLTAATEEDFSALVAENFEGAAITSETKLGSELSTTYSEFLLDASRQAGDITVCDSESGYYVVMFLGRDDNHYSTVSVRHILVKAVDSDSDGAYSDEEKQTAYDAILKVQDEFEADPTEDNFIALVSQYSEDTAEGGLYEEVYKGYMVEEFNDFCFAEGRKSGDYGIVWGESSEYAGYHLIYFVGAEGRPYSSIMADNALRGAAYSEWETSVTEGYSWEKAMCYGLVS